MNKTSAIVTLLAALLGAWGCAKAPQDDAASNRSKPTEPRDTNGPGQALLAMLNGRPAPCATAADCPGGLCQISASAFYYEEAGQGGFCLSLASAREPWERETLVLRILAELKKNPAAAAQLGNVAALRVAEAIDDDGGCPSCGFVLLYRELIRAQLVTPGEATRETLAALAATSTDVQARLAAAEALCLLGQEAGCQRLQEACTAEAEAQRAEALRALGRLCDPKRVPFLVARLEEETSRFGRLGLLEAVKQCAAPSRSPIEQAFRRNAVDYEEGL